MLNENQFVAIAMNDMQGIQKGEKLFVDMTEQNIRVRKIESRNDDGNVVFRLTNKETSYHQVASLDGYYVVVPDGARLKQALWRIAQLNSDLRIYAIAEVKELYLRNKLLAKSFVPDSEFSNGMREFTKYCNNHDDFESGSRAFDIFLKLCKKYN